MLILPLAQGNNRPQGDLEDLLGDVGDDYTVPTSPGGIPDIPLNAEHPYHLVVV